MNNERKNVQTEESAAKTEGGSAVKTATKEKPVAETGTKKTPVVAKKAVKRDASDGIRCRSVTTGGLYMEGIKSHILYEWYDADVRVDVEYQDIVAAIRSHSNFIFKPYFIIEDEDVLAEYPAVAELYNNLYSLGELADIFKLPHGGMIATIKTLPAGVQDTIKNLASKMISTGELDSIKRIKALDEYFGTKMSLLAGLGEE